MVLGIVFFFSLSPAMVLGWEQRNGTPAMLSSGAGAGGGASGLGAAAREVNVFFTHFLFFSLAAPAHMRPPTGC